MRKLRPPQSLQGSKVDRDSGLELEPWRDSIRVDLGIENDRWLEIYTRSRRWNQSPFQFELDCKERQRLREAVVSSKASKRDDFRARVVLLAAAGISNVAIAGQLNTRRETVQKWRKRFFEKRLDGLRDQPRGGAPRSVPKLIEIALIGYVAEDKTRARESKQLQLPYSRYSIRDLHALLIRDFGELAPALATVYRIMDRLELRPWLNKAWIHIRDPNFLERGARVLDLYQGIWEGEELGPDDHVICADEMTQLKVVERITMPPRPGQVATVDFEVEKHGLLKMHAGMDVGTGKVHYRFVEESNGDEFRTFVRRVMAEAPYDKASRVFWVVDNGSCHAQIISNMAKGRVRRASHRCPHPGPCELVEPGRGVLFQTRS